MIYKNFIEGVKKSRPLNEWFEHSERHHILPICKGGTDDEGNLIYLTYREHFTAHKLLALENPFDMKLVCAFWRMCNGNKDCTPEDYEIGRKLWKETPRSQEYRESLSKSLRGRRPSEIAMRKAREARLGKKLSEDHIEKLRKAQSKPRKNYKSHPHTEESRRKISEAKKGICTEQMRKNLDRTGWHPSEETRKLLSIASSRRDYPRVCKKCGAHFIAGKTAQFCEVCRGYEYRK